MKTSCTVGLALVSFALGCAGSPDTGSQSDDSTATEYVSIVDFNGSAFQDVWYGIGSNLAQEFTAACGGTFCKGTYSNLTPLTFSCSVSSKLGSVHDCAWTFAGSAEAVDPKSSAIAVDVPTFSCHVHPKTTAAKLTTLLSNSTDPLHETLPGTTGSINDSLADCFEHPIGSTPVTVVTEPSPTYVEASDYYATAANKAKWASAKAALKLGFDNICGDTYCGSDYGDLQSLAFVCSVTKSTGKLKSCAWLFGGSYAGVDPKGAVTENTKSFNCPVPVKGTLSQLITTLNAAGTDAIQTPLPGTTGSAYDALGGCLP